jgi:hypothetical protein
VRSRRWPRWSATPGCRSGRYAPVWTPLEAEDIIVPGDPDVVAARIKRADRRPQGWDLDLGLVRDDLDATTVVVLEHRFPGLGGRLAAAAQLGTDAQPDGVQSPQLVAIGSEAVDNWPCGVQQLHPEPRTGCNQRTTGVQLAQSRGAAVAPEPYKEPSREPAAPAPANESLPAAGAVGGRSGPAGEFFAALGPGWRLTAAQRARLAPAVTTALNAGRAPRTLAASAGANTSGVRNPYAVLAARLTPAELPLPRTQRPSRPPWCGQCDERTRMLGFDGDEPRPCPRPRCKTQPASMQAGPAWVIASPAAESTGQKIGS